MTATAERPPDAQTAPFPPEPEASAGFPALHALPCFLFLWLFATSLSAALVSLSGRAPPVLFCASLCASVAAVVVAAAAAQRRFLPAIAGHGWAAGGAAAALALAAYGFLRRDLNYDFHCHYALTCGILHGNIPPRDPAWPPNILPYHYIFDLLAALVQGLRLVAERNPHVEVSLDAASAISLFVLLLSAVLLLREAASLFGRVRGRGWVPAMLLIVLGGGFSWLAPLIGEPVYAWHGSRYEAFHPLVQYLGRRPAVLGQAAFCFSLATALRLHRLPSLRGWYSWLALLASSSVLLLGAPELLVAVGLFGLALLGSRAARPAAVLLFSAVVPAMLLSLAQGGVLAALRAGGWMPGGVSLHFPRLPTFFHFPPPATSARFWTLLLVEAPPTIWLMLWFLGRRAFRDRERAVARAVLFVVLMFLIAPTVLSLGFSPRDAQRLLLMPSLLSFVLFPVAQPRLARFPRAGLLLGASLVVAMAVGPIRHAARGIYRPPPGFQPDLSCAVPEELLTPGRVWIASAPFHAELLLNGHLVLSAPYGTYGPFYFEIPPEQHARWHGRYLAAPGFSGAARAALNDRDARRVVAATAAAEIAAVSVTNGDTLHILGFSSAALAADLPVPGIGNASGAEQTAYLDLQRRLTGNTTAWLLESGAIRERNGELGGAVERYRQALQENPGHADGLIRLGMALARSGRNREARDALEKALARRPDHADAANDIGLTLLSEGRAADAQAQFRRALDIDPANLRALNNLAAVCQQAGRIAEAEGLYERALRVDGSHPETLYNLGQLLAASGRHAAARRRFEQALLIKPDFAEAYAGLGAALVKDGDLQGTIACFRTAVRNVPEDPMLLNNLGGVLLMAGEADKAERYITTALRIRPDYSEAIRNLEAAKSGRKQGRTPGQDHSP
jgi:tetratricopeptide (TPR) repeat protein